MAYEAGDRVLVLGVNHPGTVLKVRDDGRGVPLYDIDLDKDSGYANDYCVARECELTRIP